MVSVCSSKRSVISHSGHLASKLQCNARQGICCGHKYMSFDEISSDEISCENLSLNSAGHALLYHIYIYIYIYIWRRGRVVRGSRLWR